MPPDSSLARPGNPTRFVLKRGDAGASWLFFRSQLAFDMFWEARQEQVFAGTTPGSSAGLNDEESYGARLGFRWEVGARSVASAAATWVHRDYNNLANSGCTPDLSSTCNVNNSNDVLATAQAGLDYALGLKTSLGFGVALQRSNGSVAGDYDEISARVQLVRTF